MISIITLYYNILGPQSYMRSVVDRNVVMRRISVYKYTSYLYLRICSNRKYLSVY